MWYGLLAIVIPGPGRASSPSFWGLTGRTGRDGDRSQGAWASMGGSTVVQTYGRGTQLSTDNPAFFSQQLAAYSAGGRGSVLYVWPHPLPTMPTVLSLFGRLFG